MSYFIPGLWHFATALAFATALGIIDGGDALLWLRRLEFVIPLVIASSALFWIPEGLAKKGLMKFLHYPLPDWDVLLLGPASHRHWLTHSPILPILLVALAWRYPVLLSPSLPFAWVCAGLSAGIGSHLFWDCVGSRSHKIVVVPYWFALREAASRIYLLTGTTLCCGAAVYFAGTGSDVASATGDPHPAPARLRPARWVPPDGSTIIPASFVNLTTRGKGAAQKPPGEPLRSCLNNDFPPLAGGIKGGAEAARGLIFRRRKRRSPLS